MIGIGLTVLGVVMLTGRSLTFNIPKLQRGGSDGSLVSMYLFGVSDAIASLSCAILPFLSVTASPSANLTSRTLAFLLYGAGMGLVIAVLTVAVAVASARSGVISSFRSFVPHMNRIAGGLMVVAGAYVTYYGWYEWRVIEHNDLRGGGVFDRA